MKSKTLIKIRAALVLGTFCVAIFSGHAATVKADFVSFDIPSDWSCQKEELDWICLPNDKRVQAEVFMTVVNKTIDPEVDNPVAWEQELKQSREVEDENGKKFISESRYVRQTKIGEQIWTDSVHVHSEIPGYITRYLMRVDGQIVTVVSYSIGESVYTKHSALMAAIVESLKQSFDPKLFRELMDTVPERLMGIRRPPPAQFRPKERAPETPPEDQEQNGDTLFYIIVGAALLAFVGFVAWKRKK